MGNISRNSDLDSNPAHFDDSQIQEYLNEAAYNFIRKYSSYNLDKRTAPSKSLRDFFVFQCLGKGAFAKVYLAQEKSPPKNFFAIKVLNKRQILGEHQWDHVMAEKRLLTSVNFPFLIILHYSFQDFSNLYLALEFMVGGELFGLLRRKMSFSEETARFFSSQVVLALEYLHNVNIVYRDLKPENILLGMDGYIKVADFGFAKLVPNRTYTICGTPEYLAPEIIASKGYSRAVDWWAFGVLVYELVAGFSPFFSEDHQRMYEKILINRYSFPRSFSKEMRSLIKRLLEPDLSKRIGSLFNKVNDVKEHRWFSSSHVNWVALFEKRQPLPPQVAAYDFNKRLLLGPETVLDIDSHDVYSKIFDDF